MAGGSGFPSGGQGDLMYRERHLFQGAFIIDLGAGHRVGAMGKGQTSTNLLLSQKVGERLEEGRRGVDAVAVASIPVRRCFPGDARAAPLAPWHPSPGREGLLLWLRCHQCRCPPPGSLQARLCSERLIGALNSGKRLRLGTLFGRAEPSFSSLNTSDASDSALKSPED